MHKGIKNQRGIALLIITIIMAMVAITYFFSNISPAELKIDRQMQTQTVLKKAKTALLAYALTHADQPADAGEFGDLPCPDLVPGGVGGVGASDSPCGTDKAISIGYLPWKSLGVDTLKDPAGNCLFYAVSPNYKITTTLLMLNADSNGLFQIVDSTGSVVEGSSAETRPVAVVFAAGQALAGQNRTPDGATICSPDYNNLSAYPDNDGVTDNANPLITEDVIRVFVNGSTGSENTANPLNDQLITINREEIWGPILRRSDFNQKMDNLTQAIALCLTKYADGNAGRRLPWPALTNFASADYRTDANYDGVAGALYAGRLPYTVDSSNLLTGAAENVLFAMAGCDVLLLADGVTTVNLKDLTTEYGKLWRNWKDHFFYALSKYYEPVSGLPAQSDCDVSPNECITVEGVTYAGVIFFSGKKIQPQSRNAPPPTGENDDKALISNYIENGNDGIFSIATGTLTDAYNTKDPLTSNDIMWCIKNKVVGVPLEVIQC